MENQLRISLDVSFYDAPSVIIVTSWKRFQTSEELLLFFSPGLPDVAAAILSLPALISILSLPTVLNNYK